MKKTLFLVILLSMSLLIKAQDQNNQRQETENKSWKVGGMFQANFSQVALDNWVAGGESSYSLLGTFKVHANYLQDKTSWDNDLEIAYGNMLTGDEDAKKTDDRVNLSSTFGYNAVGKWYYAANLTMKTQLFDGFDYTNPADPIKVSSSFAPAELIYSLGIQYKPNKDFLLLISPLTGKTVLVLDSELSDLGVFGIPAGESSMSQMGLYLKLKYKKEVFKNITFSTKFDMFGTYEDLSVWDIDWEASISMKVNDWLSANILTHLIYNEDLSSDIQFKEVFGLGLGVKF